MFAGVPGKGAEQAGYTTAIFLEFLKCQGLDFSGGAADLMKCFDQISRPLARAILAAAGFPPNLLRTYFHMLDNLTVYNTFAGHIGQPHHHAAGFPKAVLSP